MIIQFFNEGGGSSSADTATIQGLLDRSITAVTIPSAVTSVGDYALAGCSALTSMTFKASEPPTIASTALQDVTMSAVTVNVPEGSKEEYKAVEQLSGSTVYDGTEGYVEITYADGTVKKDIYDGDMGGFIYQGRNNIVEAKFVGIRTIGLADFNECNNLTSITISTSVTNIQGSAFANCTSLSSVNYEGTIEQWKSNQLDGNWCFMTLVDHIHCSDGDISLDYQYTITKTDGSTFIIHQFGSAIEGFTFQNKSYLASVDFGNIEQIQYMSFASCANLTSVTVTSSVNYIVTGAFNGCQKLADITFESVTAPTIEGGTFTDLPSEGTLHLPNGYTGYDSIISTYFSGWTIELPPSVTLTLTDGTTKVDTYDDGMIPVYGYLGRPDIAGVVLSGIKQVQYKAFYDCTSITSLTICDNCYFGGWVFQGCTSLTSVTVPTGCVVDNGAFEDCGLVSITLPSDLPSVKPEILQGCTALTSITYGGTVAQWIALEKGENWHTDVPSTTVVTCTDGSVTLYDVPVSSDSTTVYLWYKEGATNFLDLLALGDEQDAIYTVEPQTIGDNAMLIVMNEDGDALYYYTSADDSPLSTAGWCRETDGGELTDDDKEWLSAIMDYENITANTSASGVPYITAKVYRMEEGYEIDEHFLTIPD